MSSKQQKTARALGLLWDHYGKQEVDGDDDILGVLVRTILSQSTNKANTDRAFATLLETFEGDWGAVRSAPTADVADSIAVGGLSNQKAPRIQGILAKAKEDSPAGEYELEFLRDRATQDAIRYLEGLPGVGPKTARFTMMYAAGADLFPMDTHIFRILERLELLAPQASDSKAHTLASDLIPSGEGYAAHMVLVEHGRQCCRAKSPRCEACPVASICAFGDDGL